MTDPNRSVPIFYPGEKLQGAPALDPRGIQRRPHAEINLVDKRIIYKLDKNPEHQYVVYLFAQGLFNLCPIIQHDGNYYSLEVDPNQLEEAKTIQQLRAERILFQAVFGDHDHRDEGKLPQNSHDIHELQNLVIAYAGVNHDGEKVYKELLYDFEMSGYRRESETYASDAHYEIRDEHLPFFEHILQEIADRVEDDVFIEAITTRVNWSPEERANFQNSIQMRLGQLRIKVKIMQAIATLNAYRQEVATSIMAAIE